MQPSSRLDNGDDNRDYMEEDAAGLLLSFIFDSIKTNGGKKIFAKKI